jgi:hypothetical protein
MVILDMLVAAPTTELIRVLLTRYTLVLTKPEDRPFKAKARAKPSRDVCIDPTDVNC